MYQGLAKIAQGANQMYHNAIARPLAIATLGASIAGCATVIQPYDVKLADWRGLPTVQKQDANLARTIAGRTDVFVASRDLDAYCAQDAKKQTLCDELIKNNYATVTVDGSKVIGALAVYIILKGAGSSGGSAAPAARVGGFTN